MRNTLTLGALAVIVLLIVANGPVVSHSKFTMLPKSQSAAALVLYDEYGNPEVFDELYPGSITNNPSDVFYKGFYEYSLPDYSYHPYNAYYEAYYSSHNPRFDNYYYDTWGSQVSDFYYQPPSPPPPTQPWYVQVLPGVGTVAQTIVQGVVPQTRSSIGLSCSISGNPSVVPYDGSTVLRWVSQGAEWADLTELGTVDSSGSWQFDGLTRTKTFTLNISGPGGIGSCSTTVTVQPRR